MTTGIKIKEAKIGFMDDIYIGRRSYIIEMDDFGYETKLQDLATDIASFGTVCFKGSEPFKQKMSEVCKEVQKLNPFTTMIMYTDGTIRPAAMSTISNSEYFIFIKDKKSGVPYEERINENALKYLSKHNAKFIFTIYDIDEIDDIYMLITGMNIKKTDVYINIQSEDFAVATKKIEQIGFNVYVKFEGVFYDEEKESEETDE
jgi:hypothetical protein